jgi:hypothetical protein
MHLVDHYDVNVPTWVFVRMLRPVREAPLVAREPFQSRGVGVATDWFESIAGAPARRDARRSCGTSYGLVPAVRPASVD